MRVYVGLEWILNTVRNCHDFQNTRSQQLVVQVLVALLMIAKRLVSCFGFDDASRAGAQQQ